MPRIEKKKENVRLFYITYNFISCYMTLDKAHSKAENKYETWGTVVDLKKKGVQESRARKIHIIVSRYFGNRWSQCLCIKAKYGY